MTRTPAKRATHREPMVWLLIAFPLSAVLGGFVTLWLAVTTDDGLVVDDYYQRGKTINRVLLREQQAEELGLEAVLRIDPAGRISVSLRGDAPGQDLPSLRLMHPAQAQKDYSPRLSATAPGQFQAKVPALTAARWYVRLETPQWRLTGAIRIPEQTATTLRPR